MKNLFYIQIINNILDVPSDKLLGHKYFKIYV